MRKAALHNLGCKVNAYETEAMQQLLEKAGYEIVPFEEEADVYVVNTCSVTNVADKKSRQMLHRAKKRNPEGVVVAVGCYAQVAAEKLKEDAAVDIIIGNNKKGELARILEEYFEGTAAGPSAAAPPASAPSRSPASGLSVAAPAGVPIDVVDLSRARDYEPLSISRTAGHTRAFIKIQDGCDQFCSYCIIPYARGRVRSRGADEIVAEAETLAGAGFQEIVLTGIHISSYGADMPAQSRVSLIQLMERLDGIAGIRRMRLGSLEPRIVTEGFVRRMAALRTICPHFHLSLQSGCDATLRRMNRRYTTAEYEDGCRLLRRYFDRPAITTDVITGFPGETEEEFAETEAFLRKIGFYELHVFPYSRREGTRAAAMAGQVAEAVKKERSAALLRLDREASLAYRKSFLGEEKEVLLEEKITVNGADYLAGHTREYLRAVIPWDEAMRGKLVTGRLLGMISEELLLLSHLHKKDKNIS